MSPGALASLRRVPATVQTQVVVYGGAGALLVLASFLAVHGLVGGLVALGLVSLTVAIVCAGSELVGASFVAAAFATAPMYKGLAPAGSPVTPTDLCLVAGFGLLLPRMIGNSFLLPARYVVSILVIIATGILGSVTSTGAPASLLALGFWLAVLLALPTAVHLWRPSRRTVQTLAWSFVAGHLVSSFGGMAVGHYVDGRLYGLTNHPNYFAESGVITFGLLLHLLATTRRKAVPAVLLVVTVFTVYESGSRAGTLTLAALVLLVPVVERSAIKAYALALIGAVGAVLLGLSWATVSHQGSIERLMGQGSAVGSDHQRAQGLAEGWHRFLDHPLTGSGLVDLFNVHNNYLEAAIGIGIFGLFAFLVVLWTLGKPLFGSDDLRRVCYTVPGYAVFGATTPALYDRTYWVAMSLSIVVVGAEYQRRVLARSTTVRPVPARLRPVPAR